MSQPLALALVPVVAYLVGAIPFALLIGRAVGVDLRNQGTGNLGAGNLTRLAGVRYGATAAIADGCKGLVPVLVARRIGLPAEVAAVGGVAGVVGHNWLFRQGVAITERGLSPWMGFQAALVGSTVARLLPAGGAVTPVAMAWTVRDQAPGAGGAAVRATGLNYAGLLIGTGLSLAAISIVEPVAGWGTGMQVAAGIGIAAGLGVMAVTTRLGALGHRLPAWLRSRLGSTMIDHPLDARSQGLLWGRLAAETLVLGLVLVAFGLSASPLEVAAAFGLSQIASGIPGTPGGIGFAEAGLVGALALFGLGAAATLAPILVFRVVSYWLPAGAGLVVGSRVFLTARGSVAV